MSVRVPIQPSMLAWACERAGKDVDAVVERFPQLDAWLRRESQPTLRQLELFAKAMHTPIGYFFLSAPPEERLPIPDLRTVASRGVRRPSVDLLDSIYACQQRQSWYREFALDAGARALDFVGSVSTDAEPVNVAADMRRRLRFGVETRGRVGSWEDALRDFRARVDDLGVLVMASGIVGNDTHRPLDVEEFRGFALVDDVAPLVFVNAADSRAAQMFTLAHELAHIWAGEAGVSGVDLPNDREVATERWCNRVAAEVLVPASELTAVFRAGGALADEIARLTKHFKVSTLVVLRRLYDIGVLDRETLRREYGAALARLPRSNGSGGDFYKATRSRLGERFIRSVIVSAHEGQTLYGDAYRLIGVKPASFERLAGHLGVA